MSVRDSLGRFVKGLHHHPSTEFKKGQHWRERKPFWSRDWLYNEYITKGRTTTEIAKQFGVTDNAICFWLNKHGIEGRKMAEIRAKKHWGLSGATNGILLVARYLGRDGVGLDLSMKYIQECAVPRLGLDDLKEWMEGRKAEPTPLSDLPMFAGLSA